MNLRMIESKITAEGVSDVEAAVKKMLLALHAAQPEGVRYASALLPDGETIVALLQVDDGVENPIMGLPEYRELLETVEGVRADPPKVESWDLIGSYRMFEGA